MISTYIRFGKVIVASGPVDEGFPNGTRMTDPPATPVNQYALVSDGQASEMFPNVMKAGRRGRSSRCTSPTRGPTPTTSTSSR